MADLKISELSSLAGGDLAAADLAAVVDNSASETKKISIADLIANGVTLISDDTIPGAKILFSAGEIENAALAANAVATANVQNGAITGAKIANEATVDLVTTLPAAGFFVGQLALDTDDNKMYCWDGSQWVSFKAAGSVNTINGDTAGIVNIAVSTSGDTVTITTSIDDTASANQFLAGPTSGSGAVAYRTIAGSDLPTATTSAKGGVIVNGEGLRIDTDTIEIDNDVSSSVTHHIVTYNEKGLITGGRALISADLPVATSVAAGAVIPGSGLAVDDSGNINHSNSATPGTYTKVVVDGQGHVTDGNSLAVDDIPSLPASKITSGTIGSSLLATSAVTGPKLADSSTTKFGGAGATDNVVTFPDADFKGQFFYDEKNEDLYIYTGSSFVPITIISGNLILAGTYDASTNTLDSVTSAGSAAGFTQGAALPAPAVTNLNYYVVVSESGTGSGAAPAVALAPPDMLLSTGGGADFVLLDVSNAIAGQTAANISVTPAGNIAAANVQAALQELDDEKLAKAGGTMTGDLNFGAGVVIVYEGSTEDEYETTITVTDPTSDHTITFPDATGTVVTTGDTGSVTSTMIANGTIVNADVNASAAIAYSKLNLSNGIVNADINSSAAIAFSKLAALASGRLIVGNASNIAAAVDITGDVTISNAGVTSIAAGAIVDADVNNSAAITGTKIQAGTTSVRGTVQLTDSTSSTSTTTAATPNAVKTAYDLAAAALAPGDIGSTVQGYDADTAKTDVVQSFTAAQRGSITGLSDGATITPDFAAGNNFSVTLGGNRTLANPSNLTAGQSGVIVVTQDGTGSRTLAYGSYWKFAGGTAPTLTTTASAVDVIAYYVESATRITAQALLNVS